MKPVHSDHMRLDERSLALHRLIAVKVRDNPALLDKARDNLRRWQEAGNSPSHALAEWARIITGPVDQVAQFLEERSERATRLRQSSPFCGILTEAERRAIYESYSTRTYKALPGDGETSGRVGKSPDPVIGDIAMAGWKVFLISLPLLLLIGASAALGSETVTVNKTSNGKEIHIRSGDVIRVELEELGAAGYVWEIQDLDTAHFEVLSEKAAERQRQEGAMAVGGSVLKIWLIKAKEAGEAELRLYHHRIWEGKENRGDTFSLKVEIK